jgi:phosphate starvation-inducible PhoH-like protein
MAKNTKRTSSTATKEPRTTRTTKSSLSKPTTDTKTFIPRKTKLKCKNKKQKDFANLIDEKEIVIASGPSGVGKSYITIAKAIELLENSENPYKTIIISKPAVEAGEKHGFLPGDMKEKMEPYVASSIDIVDKLLGKTTREKLVENGHIKVEALAFIRGKSIDNAILVMEEAQNMSPSQVKTLLTRIGENSKFIISGDLDQSDKYTDVKYSGLYDIMARHRNIDEIGFFEFSNEDIVRNPIICKILKNYGGETIIPHSSDIKPQKVDRIKIYKVDTKAKTKNTTWFKNIINKIF